MVPCLLRYGTATKTDERRSVARREHDRKARLAAKRALKYPAVQKMRSLRPDWDSGVLAATSVGDLTGLEGDFLALNQARITARTVRNANDAGKTVYAWTVNDPLGIARMLWIGVDGLITDDPALARTVLEEYNDLSIGERFLLTISDSVGDIMTFDQVEELRP
jgi:glycerophosphoryl diester phosphodiesterase